MNKKVVVIGGGTGCSGLLRGLKKFPLDLSAIVTVCDDNKSTGKIREEFNMPAVGDLRRTIVALSEASKPVEDLFNYRFKTNGDLDGHALGNLLIAASYEINGNLSKGIKALSKILNLKGRVIPLTEDNITLMGEMIDGTIVEGEHRITQTWDKTIKRVYYKNDFKVSDLAIKSILEADLIILSMGSVWTSIIPNLLPKDIIKSIDKSNSKILYVCNAMTQPGETDAFKASDHINLLNRYLGKKKIDTIIVSTRQIDDETKKKYETLEQKDPVKYDPENIKSTKVIEADLFNIENNVIRHDPLKLAFEIYAYLMKEE